MRAEIPSEESARLAALRALAVLDTPREKDFDDLAALAAQICEAPIALVTLMEEERQWFKAAVGTDLQETHRDASFCAHALLQRDLFIVPDATLDPRFADNPLVTGEPHVRFYAGALLENDEGLSYGSLCVLDVRPRTLSETQAQALRVLARQVVVQLELRRQVRERAKAAEVLEARVAERTAQLEAAMKEMDGFNYSVSHDLRAPLRAIVSTASMLLEELGPELESAYREMLERQCHNANRLGLLIDELLALSRLGRTEVRRQPIDVTALAHEVVLELAQADMLATCAVEIQDGMQAYGDPTLLRLLLTNLLSNACKFSPQGGRIRVRKDDRDGKDVFSVKDDGVGFNPGYSNKVFLPFERLVTEAEFPGTGIGLANVERIAQRHGGRVWANSMLGKGSTFYFTLNGAA